MVHRPFWFHILNKEGFRESRDNSQNRTLLDIPKYTAADRQGADIQSKVDELEALNHAMRDRDKLKDDDSASDQLIALTARLDSIVLNFAFLLASTSKDKSNSLYRTLIVRNET